MGLWTNWLGLVADASTTVSIQRGGGQTDLEIVVLKAFAKLFHRGELQ